MDHTQNNVTTEPPVEQAPLPESKITCDYLVVGAGTSCLSFVDTVLTLRKDATFVIVDRLSSPGGHWTKAYPFVRLHQPSCNYGVNSLPLAELDKNGKEIWNQNERASGKEICEYYKQVVENFEATGRVKTYFDTNYEGEAKDVDGSSINKNSNNYDDPTGKITHIITNKDGWTIFVDCTKVVRCESKVQVPSMREGLPFPINESVVKSITLNELPSNVGPDSSYKKYLVVGGGKSGTDAITYMLKEGTVRPDQITWIVPRAAWYFIRDRMNRSPIPGTGFWKDGVNALFRPITAASSAKEAFLNMEKIGTTQRVDPDDFPTVFKGATIDQAEMNNLRKIKNIVKNKGRITAITEKEVIFANGAHSIPFSPNDTLVVDCSSGNSYGYLDFDEDFRFFNPHKIRLGPLTSFLSPSHTSTQVAFLECEYSDTASGDEVKNSYLYFARGPSELREDGWLQMFLLAWLAHMKTDLEFNKCPNYRGFVLRSRTDRQQPDHHGGLLGLLWAIFGPTKLLQKTKAFQDKMENGGFADFPTNPLPGRTGVDASKLEANLRNPPQAKPKKSKMKQRIFHTQKHRSTKQSMLPEKKASGSTAASVEIRA